MNRFARFRELIEEVEPDVPMEGGRGYVYHQEDFEMGGVTFALISAFNAVAAFIVTKIFRARK